MSNRISNIPFFIENITSIKKTSEDSANLLSMIDAQTPVINFDKVKEAYVKSFGANSELTSVDTLALQNNGEWAFIEFKNGEINPKERRKIWLKVKSSLLIFCDVAQVELKFTRNKLNFYLIYNSEKNPVSDTNKNKISNYIASKANDENIRFGLKRYCAVFFKSVHTYSEKQFQEEIIEKFDTIDDKTVLY